MTNEEQLLNLFKKRQDKKLRKKGKRRRQGIKKNLKKVKKSRKFNNPKKICDKGKKNVHEKG